MPSNTLIPKFEEFNENPSKCSAWLKAKDRCCERRIASADQKRKISLLQSVSRNRIYGGDEAEELADLYFCNGWHRPGGKYAIPLSEKYKVVQALFPNAEEPTTLFIPAPEPRELHILSLPDRTQEPASLDFSEAQRLSFSIAQSGVQSSGYNVSPPLATPQVRQDARMRGMEPEFQSEASIPARQSPRIRGREPEAPLEVPIPARRQSVRIRGQEPEASREMPIPARRQSARIRGQEPEASREVPIPARRESARLRGQRPEISPEPSIPTRRSALRGQGPGASLEVPIPARQNARIRGQEPEASLEVPIPARRQSARIRQQPATSPEASIPAASDEHSTTTTSQRGAQTELAEPAQPSLQTFALMHQESIRHARLVDVHQDCPICIEALEDSDSAARCNSCCTDFHGACVVEWFTTPNKRQRCPFCRTEVTDEHVEELISKVEDLGDRQRFQWLYREKRRGRY